MQNLLIEIGPLVSTYWQGQKDRHIDRKTDKYTHKHTQTQTHTQHTHTHIHKHTQPSIFRPAPSLFILLRKKNLS